MSCDPTVDVQIACDDDDIPDVEDIRSWVRRALAQTGQPLDAGTEVSVRVVDAGEIQALNRDFREQDKATNVLSFPAADVTGLPPGEARVLGDIVVCAEVVSREAAAQGKSVGDHWAHMLVHGALHLAGYDHVDETQAAEMEGLERRVLLQFGLADPYGESPVEN